MTSDTVFPLQPHKALFQFKICAKSHLTSKRNWLGRRDLDNLQFAHGGLNYPSFNIVPYNSFDQVQPGSVKKIEAVST